VGAVTEKVRIREAASEEVETISVGSTRVRKIIICRDWEIKGGFGSTVVSLTGRIRYSGIVLGRPRTITILKREPVNRGTIMGHDGSRALDGFILEQGTVGMSVGAEVEGV
jgi:hypothetical protein